MTPVEIAAAFDEVELSGNDREFWRMMRFISDDDQRLVQWEPRVRAILNHKEALFVAEAITVLASRWKLAEFSEECQSFIGHEDEDVRTAALLGSESLGLDTGDVELATVLLEVLTDSTRNYGERRIALLAIPRVLEGNNLTAHRSRLQAFQGTAAGFEELVPWEEINEIMDKHRP